MNNVVGAKKVTENTWKTTPRREDAVRYRRTTKEAIKDEMLWASCTMSWTHGEKER